MSIFRNWSVRTSFSIFVISPVSFVSCRHTTSDFHVCRIFLISLLFLPQFSPLTFQGTLSNFIDLLLPGIPPYFLSHNYRIWHQALILSVHSPPSFLQWLAPLVHPIVVVYLHK
uniref:Putative ovule protein n=1 Tax=Solanum chacoense TaxID=4108 RepID=A0A0V0IJ25_SOLCH